MIFDSLVIGIIRDIQLKLFFHLKNSYKEEAGDKDCK